MLLKGGSITENVKSEYWYGERVIVYPVFKFKSSSFVYRVLKGSYKLSYQPGDPVNVTFKTYPVVQTVQLVWIELVTGAGFTLNSI